MAVEFDEFNVGGTYFWVDGDLMAYCHGEPPILKYVVTENFCNCICAICVPCDTSGEVERFAKGDETRAFFATKEEALDAAVKRCGDLIHNSTRTKDSWAHQLSSLRKNEP